MNVNGKMIPVKLFQESGVVRGDKREGWRG
jgi:hypothetical protein